MTYKAQQIVLDNALVASENQRVIGKCNMGINPRMKPKESTYQLVSDALALTTCYHAFLITAEVPVIYVHQFWAIVDKHKASYRFKIDNKRFSVNVEVFRDILNIYPRIPGQEFDEPPTKEEALSFIRELGHFGEIKYITDVIIDHLHQPWRTFTSIIKKCLCGKETPSKKKPTKAKKDVPSKKKPTSKRKPTKKKALALADRSKGDGPDFESRVPDEQQRKTFGADEGTGTKPGVPDVEIDANDDKEASDNEKTDFDKDENLNLNPNDDEEEEIEEEDVRTPDRFEFNNDDEEYDELYKDVNVRSKVTEHEEVGKRDAEMTDTTHESALKEKSYEQVIEDTYVALTSSQKTEGSKQSFSVSSDFASKFLNLDNVPPVINEVASMMSTFMRMIQSTINESLENVVLAKSSSQPQSTYEATTSLTKFELKKIPLDKLEKSKSHRAAEQHKDLYDALVKSYQLDKDLFDSYDIEIPQDQGDDLGNTKDQPNVEEASKHEWFKKLERPLTIDRD
nr:hypothetical protein [Tanacetum cinerariifolium]